MIQQAPSSRYTTSPAFVTLRVEFSNMSVQPDELKPLGGNKYDIVALKRVIIDGILKQDDVEVGRFTVTIDCRADLATFSSKIPNFGAFELMLLFMRKFHRLTAGRDPIVRPNSNDRAATVLTFPVSSGERMSAVIHNLKAGFEVPGAPAIAL